MAQSWLDPAEADRGGKGRPVGKLPPELGRRGSEEERREEKRQQSEERREKKEKEKGSERERERESFISLF